MSQLWQDACNEQFAKAIKRILDRYRNGEIDLGEAMADIGNEYDDKIGNDGVEK